MTWILKWTHCYCSVTACWQSWKKRSDSYNMSFIYHPSIHLSCLKSWQISWSCDTRFSNPTLHSLFFSFSMTDFILYQQKLGSHYPQYIYFYAEFSNVQEVISELLTHTHLEGCLTTVEYLLIFICPEYNTIYILRSNVTRLIFFWIIMLFQLFCWNIVLMCMFVFQLRGFPYLYCYFYFLKSYHTLTRCPTFLEKCHFPPSPRFF